MSVAVLSKPSVEQSFNLEVSSRSTSEVLHKLAQRIVRAIDNQHLYTAAAIVRRLAMESCEFSEAYLLRVANALETQCWDTLAEDFINRNFVGQTGYILLVGPFARLIDGQKQIKLTAIFGQVEAISLPIQNLEALTQATYGTLLQPIPPVLPVKSLFTCGNIGGEEAFLSPDGWCFPHSERGWGLINMTAHLQRLDTWVVKRLYQIFEPKTAALIAQVLNSPAMQLQEYCLHEAGHGAGLGMWMKIKHELLPDAQQSGWEEYKTDVVGFYLADKVLTPEQVGQTVAATLCIRFGIDAHRPGGAEGGPDAFATLLMLDRMLMSGELQVLDNGQLGLREASFKGLYNATRPHRLESKYLVWEELAQIDYPEQVLELYRERQPRSSTKALFNQLVDRCR
jgi:Family of unknown function (DUF6014)